MPNHVTTIISVKDFAGKSFDEVRQVILNDKGDIDFNKLVPMPECLVDFNPHGGIESRAKAALGLLVAPTTAPSGDLYDLTKRLEFSNAVRETTKPIDEADVPLLVRAIQNYSECGHLYWYSWSLDNWGTKWNAYDQSITDDSLQFDTAWSHPGHLIEVLSKMLPEVTFSVKYADEDIGSNCGSYVIKNGVKSCENIAPKFDDMTEAQKCEFKSFAFKIVYGDDDPATHGYDANWQYSDELYERANA